MLLKKYSLIIFSIISVILLFSFVGLPNLDSNLDSPTNISNNTIGGSPTPSPNSSGALITVQKSPTSSPSPSPSVVKELQCGATFLKSVYPSLFSLNQFLGTYCDDSDKFMEKITTGKKEDVKTVPPEIEEFAYKCGVGLLRALTPEERSKVGHCDALKCHESRKLANALKENEIPHCINEAPWVADATFSSELNEDQSKHAVQYEKIMNEVDKNCYNFYCRFDNAVNKETQKSKPVQMIWQCTGCGD